MSQGISKIGEYRHYGLFGEPWWLDVVEPGGWEEVMVSDGGVLSGRLPFTIRRRWGQRFITMPPYTQYLGPYVRERGEKVESRLSHHRSVVEEMMRKLPTRTFFAQNFHHHVADWLPWYWEGYKQTSRVTYILDDLSDMEQVWCGLRENVRREIRKASGRESLQVVDNLGADELVHVLHKTFARQGMGLPRPGVIRRIHEATTASNHGKAWFALDERKRIHAAVLTVWDERASYYVLGGGDPDLRHSGAHSLLMWHAIEHASNNSRTFDFEGSMLPGVEKFFRSFGAKQRWYHHILRGPTPVMTKLLLLRRQ